MRVIILTKSYGKARMAKETALAIPAERIQQCIYLIRKQKIMLDRILRAKRILPRVFVPDYLFEAVARTCISLQVDGHRPDIVIIKTAKTLATYKGREETLPEDILTSSLLALSHRTRNLGMEAPATPREIEREFRRSLNEGRGETR